MVTAAGGNYRQLSVSGGVVAIHIQWICNLDWDFMRHCLPKYVPVCQTMLQIVSGEIGLLFKHFSS